MERKNLSVMQHQWLDASSEFNFKVEYMPRETNGFAGALSRVYGNGGKLVNDKDEMMAYQPPKVSTVYARIRRRRLYHR